MNEKTRNVSITTTFKYQGIDISVLDSKTLSLNSTEEKVLETKIEILNSNLSFIKNFIDLENKQ